MSELAETINAISIIDTHEHLLSAERARRSLQTIDQVILYTYLLPDLLAAGMPLSLWSAAGQEAEAAWQNLQIYLRRINNTAYFRALTRALADLHGIQPDELLHLDRATLSARLCAADDDNWYPQVLQQKAGIQLALLDVGTTEMDRRLFQPVVRLDHFLYGFKRRALSWRKLPPTLQTFGAVGLDVIEAQYHVTVRSFSDYLDLLDRAFTQEVAAGAVAIKVGLAYDRSLRFEAASRLEAQCVFEQFDDDVSAADARRFQDYMMRTIVQGAAQHGLPVQIHTGMQAGYWSALEHSNPTLLNNLFLEFPETTFDLFHGGYLYTSELAVLGKTYPNVYLNACWLPLISPSVAKRCLHEWIETVPWTKLLWGGDCQIVEETYGHALLLRRLLTEVLEEKVVAGYFGIAEATAVASGLLRDNALRLYRWPGDLTAAGTENATAQPTIALSGPA